MGLVGYSVCACMCMCPYVCIYMCVMFVFVSVCMCVQEIPPLVFYHLPYEAGCSLPTPSTEAVSVALRG